MPEGFADNDLDLDLDCDGVLDDCHLSRNSICLSSLMDNVILIQIGKQKVVHLIVLAYVMGSFQLDWYADCDYDGIAVHQNEVTVWN